MVDSVGALGVVVPPASTVGVAVGGAGVADAATATWTVAEGTLVGVRVRVGARVAVAVAAVQRDAGTQLVAGGAVTVTVGAVE